MSWNHLGESLKSGAFFYCGAFFWVYTVVVYCRETALTPLGHEPLPPPCGGKQTVRPLDQ
jgi:hypothetical protein